MDFRFTADRRWIPEFLKSRTTWRRTGYVPPPEEVLPRPEFISLSLDSPPPNENVSHFLRRTVQAVFWGLYCLFNTTTMPPWLAASVTALLALAPYFANRSTEHPYSLWWTAVLGASGLIPVGLNIAPRFDALLCYLIAGAWFLAHGATARVRYLQESAGKGSA